MTWEFSEGRPYDLKGEIIPAEESQAFTALKMLKNEAFVVLWNAQGIFWGRYDGNTLSFPAGEVFNARMLGELRVFNDTEELRLVRVGNSWLKRYVRDEADNPFAYIDCLAPLLGNDMEDCKDGYIKLKDIGRKIEIIIPATDMSNYRNVESVGLTTRNYIGKLSTGQAGYVDFRYLRLEPIGGKNDETKQCAL